MALRSRVPVLVLLAVIGAAALAPATGMPEWDLPLDGGTVVAPFRAPAHDYGPGHRGIDLAPAGTDDAVTAPASGTVLFAGVVVDRGVVTIDHGDGWVTSVEPVEPSVVAGEQIAAGDVVGALSRGGHAAEGTLHVGVRHHGEYVNPLILLGRVPRAVLLPCC